MASIQRELDSLKTNDIYSLLLFVLYKLRDIEGYSTLSELAYVLDEENFLNLCEYFGGLTITIPTIDEVEDTIDALLLYQHVDLDGYGYKEAIKLIGFDSNKLRHIKIIYKQIKNVLNKYSFNKEDEIE